MTTTLALTIQVHSVGLMNGSGDEVVFFFLAARGLRLAPMKTRLPFPAVDVTAGDTSLFADPDDEGVRGREDGGGRTSFNKSDSGTSRSSIG